MLDFRMETFLALCRTMNYTRAAEELRITQPAVTQHIQYLQRHYGVKLFSYHDKRLALTEAGEALHSAALTMEHDERELRQRLPLLEKGRQHLRLGATLTVGEYALPPHLARYMKRIRRSRSIWWWVAPATFWPRSIAARWTRPLWKAIFPGGSTTPSPGRSPSWASARRTAPFRRVWRWRISFPSP